MSFLNPLLLIGVLSAGIPLLIHLWSRRQAKTVSFSSVQFLIPLHHKKVRRLKLRQILILVLRMLILTLIALAFARPVVTSKWAMAVGGGARTSVVIVLDNSYSMDYEGLNGKWFDIAKESALQILDSLSPGDSAGLILMSDIPKVVFQRLTTDIQQVRDAIKNAQVSHRGSHVLPSMISAYTLLKESKNPIKKIYLISDLGENGWRNWKKAVWDSGVPSELREGINIAVIRVGEKKAPNYAIEDIVLANEFVGIGMPVQISAKIKGSQVQQTVAELFVDGEKKGQSIINEGVVSFVHTFQYPGTHTGEIRLSADRLSLDDVRYFAVNVLGNIKVLSVGEHKVFVELALNPTPSSAEEPLILPANCTVEELGSSPLSQYDVVVLVDVTRLSDDAVQNLRNFSLNGGNVVVFLGNSADRDWYNNSFPLLPALLGNREPFLQSPSRISRWDRDHRIFKVFRDAEHILTTPEFYSAFTMVPNRGANVIASFDRNIPAILETDMNYEKEGGRVILFNSSPDTVVSNLPIEPAFLPLIQQTILYLVEPGEGSDRNIFVGDTYSRYVNMKFDSLPEMFDPDNNSTKLAILTDGQGSQIRYNSTERAGIYKLESKSGGSIKRDYFAVNLNTAGESDISSASDEEILDKLGSDVKFVSPGSIIETFGKSESRGSELSSRLLIFAIILVLLELPLANRYKIKEESMDVER